MANHPGKMLSTGAKELLATGLYADLTIVCGDTEFKVHKFALHTQSPYFKKLLAGDFQEGAANNNISRLLIPEDPAVFAVLIHHLYHFTYDDSTRGNVAPAPFAVHVFAAADKYDIEPLRKQAVRCLEQTLDPKDVPTLIEAVRAVEQNTANDVLWDIVIPVLRANMGALLGVRDFQDMLEGMPGLTFRLLALLDPTAGGGVPKVDERAANTSVVSDYSWSDNLEYFEDTDGEPMPLDDWEKKYGG